jgi:hypothetical protein
MNSFVELDEILPVRLDAVRRYLRATGWRQLGLKNPMAGQVPYEIYKPTNQDRAKLQVVIPVSNETADSSLRIRDAIQTIVDMENRGPAEVIQSVLRIGYDVVRSSIPSEHVRDESIRLDAATEFVANMRGLLAATATTEHRPLPYFGRVLKDSVQFADSCRFGHTYRGSFGFVVESPLPEPEPMPLLPDNPDIPFERRVIQRLARGIHHVVAANAAQNLKLITEAVGTGLSANGCELLAELIERVSPGGVTFSFDLSPAWNIAREMDSTSFSVDIAHAEVCRSAARELRRDDTRIPVDMSGRVVRLQNQTDPTDLSSQTGEHEIMVLWASRDFGDIQVRVNLTPADYLTAVNAHGAGRPVWISGALTKTGRQWFLSEPHNFTVPVQGELPLDDN